MAKNQEATLGNDSITWNRENIEQISGKTVLVIGASGKDRRFVWKTFQDLNIKVVLVDSKENKHLRDIVAVLFKYNYSENSILADESHGDAIIKLLGPTVNQLSACFTFDEYCIHLTSIVCQKLGFVGVSPDVALMVQSKQLTYDALRTEPRDYDTNQYSPLSFQIQNVSDISNAKGLSFPAILKPEYGHFSEAVSKVYSIDDCASKFNMLQSTYGKDWDGVGFGSSMVLMEFLPGIVHHIDVIIFQGVLIKALVTDMGPKLPYGFSDTTTCFPTTLPDKLVAEIIQASFDCCRKIGLDNGVFNVEMIVTPNGLKLIEINCRPGSYRRCVVFRTTNSIDLFVTLALIAAGIKPEFPKTSNVYAVGCYLYSFAHSRQLQDKTVQQKIMELKIRKEILYIERTDISKVDEMFPKCFAHLVAFDKTNGKLAKQKLIKICKELALYTNDYDLEQLTKYFY
ncbi:carnosine synthase 1-like [Mytilus trossulus]|uniref:carnosine synthase 1-like n=1 Tax=Mytilus trossulus TaxID=6551 RepID=UPI003004E7F2